MTIITHQTNIHLGGDRPTPSVTGAASGTTKWLDVDDCVAIFFSDADDVRRFAEALMEAAEGFAPMTRTDMNTLEPPEDRIDAWEASDTFASKAIEWALGDDTMLSKIHDRYAVSEQYDDDYDAWCGA